MPLLVVLLVALVIVSPVVLVPLSIVQRYRVGSSRRPARGWLATLNVVGFTFSAVMLVASAAVSAIWVPGALTATFGGLVTGLVLGWFGLLISRWERDGGGLHFTPNRWLVGVLTLLVVGRLLYGLWRAWMAFETWGAAGWGANAGIAGSLAAGALLVGYGLGFWSAVRWRITRQRVVVA